MKIFEKKKILNEFVDETFLEQVPNEVYSK